MKKNNLKRFLASLLAVLMLASVTGVAPGVFADNETGTTEPTVSTKTVAPEFKGNTGEVLIKSDYDSGKILDALAKAFLANYSDLTEEQIAAINWTYKYTVKGTYIKLGASWPTYETDEAREAKVPVLTGLTVTESYCYYNGWPKDLYADATYVYPALKDVADGTYELYANGESVGTINKVSKYSTTLVLKESATITYNKDAAAEKSAIVANLVDYTNSVIPTGTTANDFTVEVYKYTLPVVGTEIWNDISKSTLDAGDGYTIRVSYKGNDDYKASASQTATVNVTKAPVSITLPIISKLYAGEEVDPETYYEVTPDDDAIDVYLFFVGVNTNKETCVNVKLTPDQEKLLKVIPSVYDKLREGMRLSEFKEFIESIPNIDKIEVIKNILNILNTFDNISDNTVIAIGTPAHAGVYQAIAVSPETKNYEAGKGTGSLIILKNWKGIKLEKSDMFTGSKNEITVTNATKIANGEEGAYAVVLKQNGVILNNNAQEAVHYLFTGINHGKLYSSSKMPDEPGRYIVTASVRGGDFFAFPKTFSFTIVADPTPETTPNA